MCKKFRRTLFRKTVAGTLIAALVVTTFGFIDTPFKASAAGPTEFDISKGTVMIKAGSIKGVAPDGSTVNETSLNPDGYIVHGGGTESRNYMYIDANTTVTLRDVNLKSDTASVTGIFIGAGTSTSKVSLVLEGQNTVDLTASPAAKARAAVEISERAQLTIAGTGSLTTKGGYDAAGIGSSKNNAGTIIIESGAIHATAGEVSPYGGVPAGIGGGKNKKANNITINGGSINAASEHPGWGIGHGITSDDRENPVVISGGSITGKVQGSPVNADGVKVAPVILVSSEIPDKDVKALFDVDSGRLGDVKTDSAGKVRIFITKENKTVALYDGATLYYKDNVTFGYDGAEFVLQKYDGPPCACTGGSDAGVDFENQEISINTGMNQPVERVLKAKYRPCTGCTYPLHFVKDLRYEFVAPLPDSEQAEIISGNILKVYKGAVMISPMKIKASMKVNGIPYEHTADFMIKPINDVSLDLAAGSIIINGNSVTHGTDTYTIDLDKQVRIRQSNPDTPTRNYIKIEGAARSGLVDINGINIAESAAPSDMPGGIYVTVDTSLRLSGENKIDMRRQDDHSAIAVKPGAVLELSGTGSLVARGGKNSAAIGSPGMPPYNLPHGDIVINGGKIDAYGGSLACGVGGSANIAGGNITINGGDITAKPGESYPGMIPAAIGGTNARVHITGGKVTADVADIENPSIAGELTIDGGSVFLNKPALVHPKNSAGEKLYAKLLTTDPTVPNTEVAVTHYIERTPTEQEHAFKANTDSEGRLCVFVPGGATWNRYYINETGMKFYKRLRAQDHGDKDAACIPSGEAAVAVRYPQKAIDSFTLPGQDGAAVINHDDLTVALKLKKGIPTDARYVPEISFRGSQCLPEGAQNFKDSVNSSTPFDYTVIAEDGTKAVYKISITQDPSAPGDAPMFDVSLGSVEIYADRVVVTDEHGTVNTFNIPESAAVTLTGSTDKNSIVIHESRSGAINLSSLNVTGTVGKVPIKIAASAPKTSVNIKVDGLNTLKGGAPGVPAIDLAGSSSSAKKAHLVLTAGTAVDGKQPYLDMIGGAGAPAVGSSVASVSGDVYGCGKLEINSGNYKITGGTNAPAVGLHQGADSTSGKGEIVIEGGNVKLIPGAGYSGFAQHTQPVSAASELLIPMEITVAKDNPLPDKLVKLTYVSRPSGSPEVVHAEEDLLTDDEGKIYIFTTGAAQRLKITDPGTSKVYSGLAPSVTTYDLRKVAVAEGGGVIRSLTVKDPMTYKLAPVKFVVVAEDIIDPMHIYVTYKYDGTLIGKKMLVFKGDNKYEAEVMFPESGPNDAVYNVELLLNDVAQSGFKQEYVKHKRVALTGFELPGQIGASNISAVTTGAVGQADTMDIGILMPYDLAEKTNLELIPVITHNGVKIVPAAGGANDFKQNTLYTVHGKGSIDRLECRINLTYEEAPEVTALNSDKAALPSGGGAVSITATGRNFDKVSRAAEGDKKIKLQMIEKSSGAAVGAAQELVLDNLTYKADFVVPANYANSEAVYSFKLLVSGKEKGLVGGGAMPTVTVAKYNKPRVSGVSITPAQSAITYEGGNLTVAVTGNNLNPASLAAIPSGDKLLKIKLGTLGEKNAAWDGGKYTASFVLPRCDSYDTDAVYPFAVTLSGESQTLTGLDRVTVPRQKKPRVTGVGVPAPFEYEGGTCTLELTGENFEYIASMWQAGDKKVTVSLAGLAGGTDREAVLDVSQNKASVSFDLPKNKSYTEDKTYPVTVRLNGEPQTVTMTGGAIPTVKKQPKPAVNTVALTLLEPYAINPSFLPPAGGRVKVELTGVHLDKLADAPSGTPAVIRVGADAVVGGGVVGTVSPVNSVPKTGGVWEAELTVPGNTDFLKNSIYRVWVKIDDEVQSPAGLNTVTVARTLEGNNAIESMVVDKQVGATIIDHVKGTISILLPRGSNLKAVKPVITLAGVDASVSPLSSAEVDFSAPPVRYTVTAGNGSQKTYEVTINVESGSRRSPEKVYRVESGVEVERAPYLKGYATADGKMLFMPSRNMTRAEIATVFAALSGDYDPKAYNAPFADVSRSKWYAGAVGYVYEHGIVTGYSAERFAPDAPITRQEFAVMLIRYSAAKLLSAKLVEDVRYADERELIKIVRDTRASFNANMISDNDILLAVEERVNAELKKRRERSDAARVPFSDIAGAWGRAYIEEMYKSGWIGGYEDNTFRPDAYITRAEVVKVINAFLGRTADGSAFSGTSEYFADVAESHWAYYDVMVAATPFKYKRDVLKIENGM